VADRHARSTHVYTVPVANIHCNRGASHCDFSADENTNASAHSDALASYRDAEADEHTGSPDHYAGQVAQTEPGFPS